jgi:hypothetical protein
VSALGRTLVEPRVKQDIEMSNFEKMMMIGDGPTDGYTDRRGERLMNIEPRDDRIARVRKVVERPGFW